MHRSPVRLAVLVALVSGVPLAGCVVGESKPREAGVLDGQRDVRLTYRDGPPDAPRDVDGPPIEPQRDHGGEPPPGEGIIAVDGPPDLTRDGTTPTGDSTVDTAPARDSTRDTTPARDSTVDTTTPVRDSTVDSAAPSCIWVNVNVCATNAKIAVFCPAGRHVTRLKRCNDTIFTGPNFQSYITTYDLCSCDWQTSCSGTSCVVWQAVECCL